MSTAKIRRTKNPDTPEFTAKYYVNNAVLLPEVIKCKAEGKISDKLARMLMSIAERYASRPNFYGYTYKEDMISEALTSLCQNALKFNPEKSTNPFAFYTTCIYHSFLQFLGNEKKHRQIRDQLLVDLGENPSYSFVEEHKAQKDAGGEYSSELEDLKIQIGEAKDRLAQEKLADEAKAQALADAIVETTPSSLLEFEIESDPT